MPMLNGVPFASYSFCFAPRTVLLWSQYGHVVLEKINTARPFLSASTLDLASDMAAGESEAEMPKRRRKTHAILAVGVQLFAM